MRSAMKGSRLASTSSSQRPSSERKVSIQSPRSTSRSNPPSSGPAQSTMKRGTFMVDTRMRTESAKSYSNKYQDVKGMPSYGGYNPIVEPEKDMLVKRLMEKITSQAEELTSLNNALESSASYIKLCENRLQQMENSIYSQPPAVRDEISKLAKANGESTLSNLGDVAYLRRFELQHREEVEVLTRQLMEAESKLEETTKAYKLCKEELQETQKELKALEKRHNKVVIANRKAGIYNEGSTLATASRNMSKASTSSNIIPSTTNALKLELKETKDKVVQYEKKIATLNKKYENLKLDSETKLKVMEDALEYHTTEMGLSGQADLLSKIASLRGEVSALQGDLVTNNRKLDESMSENEVIHNHKESLERQIDALYARLNLTSPDKAGATEGTSKMFGNEDITSVKEHLVEVENERNLLLEYIQNDMEKSSVVEKEKSKIISQLEKTQKNETELRKELSSLRSGRVVQSTSTSPLTSPSGYLPSPPPPPSLSNDYKEKYESIQVEFDSMKLNLSRKEGEAEELSKMQVELLKQMKEKEMLLQKTVGDLKIARRATSTTGANESSTASIYASNSKPQSPKAGTGSSNAVATANEEKAEIIVSLQNDLDGAMLKIAMNEREINDLKFHIENERNKIASKDQELESWKFQSQTDQVKLSAREKEIEDLKSELEGDKKSAATIAIVEERNQLAQDVEILKSDLLNFKTIEQVLGELTEVLLAKLRSNEIKSTGSHASGYFTSSIRGSFSHSPSKTLFSGDYKCNSPDKLSHSQVGHNAVSSSQEHAVWAMLPQIRQLSLPLYECIQKLFLDYHTKELEVVEINASVSSLERKVAEMEEEKIEYLNKERDAMRDTEAMQSEINKGKGYKAVLEQVKYVLQSTPGALSGLGHILPQSAADAATRFANKEREMFLSQDSLDAGDDHKNDLSGYVDDSIFASPSSKRFSGSNNDTLLIDEFPDEHIPDIVAKALMRNFKAVNALADARIELKNLKLEREQANNEIGRLTSEHNLLEKSYEALSNQFQHEFEARQINEEKLGTDLEAALELVEKQNSLSLSFEAKIEALKRDRQVRAAQVSTLQQREDQNRKIIIGVLKDFWNEFSEVEFPRSVYVDMGLGLSSTRQLPVPNENDRLPDAVRTLSDLLAKLFNALCRSRTGESVVDRSMWGTVDSSIGRQNTNNTGAAGGGGRDGNTGESSRMSNTVNNGYDNAGSSMHLRQKYGDGNDYVNMNKTSNMSHGNHHNHGSSGSFTMPSSRVAMHDKLLAARSMLSSQRE